MEHVEYRWDAIRNIVGLSSVPKVIKPLVATALILAAQLLEANL